MPLHRAAEFERLPDQIKMTDYDIEYQKNDAACGEPFPEIVTFFKEYSLRYANVLDLGCGQGRDALMIASHGHSVHGVDVSPTGIHQMVKRADLSGVDVTGEVADIRKYQPRGEYDVVLIDRVIHMFGESTDKTEVLEKAKRVTSDGGYVLVADTQKNMELIEAAFTENINWKLVLRRKGFRFYQKAV